MIGLGNFGFSAAKALSIAGHNLIVIDTDGDVVNRIAPQVACEAVGDGTDLQTLQRVGAADADIGVSATGDDITASILATMALHDLKVKEVYVKVISHDHERIARSA